MLPRFKGSNFYWSTASYSHTSYLHTILEIQFWTQNRNSLLEDEPANVREQEKKVFSTFLSYSAQLPSLFDK